MFEELIAEALIMVVNRLDKPEPKTNQRVVYEKQIVTINEHVSDSIVAHTKLDDESTYVVVLAHGTMETETELGGIPISPRYGEFERACEGLDDQEDVIVEKIVAIKEEVRQSKVELTKLQVLKPQLKLQALKNMNEVTTKIQTYTEWGSAAGNTIVVVATAALIGVTAPVTIATVAISGASHAYIVYGS